MKQMTRVADAKPKKKGKDLYQIFYLKIAQAIQKLLMVSKQRYRFCQLNQKKEVSFFHYSN
jgi:hypothetical protein